MGDVGGEPFQELLVCAGSASTAPRLELSRTGRRGDRAMATVSRQSVDPWVTASSACYQCATVQEDVVALLLLNAYRSAQQMM
eukprot:m.78133 g.78133  ORF g.78133 m.78133 type:complete len:83 (-) comp9198_c0_seq1:210-458(-)